MTCHQYLTFPPSCHNLLYLRPSNSPHFSFVTDEDLRGRNVLHIDSIATCSLKTDLLFNFIYTWINAEYCVVCMCWPRPESKSKNCIAIYVHVQVERYIHCKAYVYSAMLSHWIWSPGTKWHQSLCLESQTLDLHIHIFIHWQSVTGQQISFSTCTACSCIGAVTLYV